MAAIPKRPSCFIHDDDDDYVTSNEYYNVNSNKSMMYFHNRSTTMSLKSVPLSSSGYASTARLYFYDTRSDHRQPHFLDSCFLCRKSLAGDNDIFMYRGDTPFCSEECRQEQIEMDEAKEKHRNVSSAMRAGVEKNLNSNKAESYSLRTGTIAAA